MTPPLFTVPIAFAPWVEASGGVERGAHAPGALGAGDVERSARVEPTELLAALRSAAAAAADPARPAAAPATGTPGQATVATTAAIVWGLGSAAMLAWFAAGLWRGHRRLRALAPVGAACRREIEALAAQLGVRVPPLRDDPAAGSPYVWGFGRTCLVVPERALAAATPKGRAAVLVHELAHLRRGDHWVAQLELLLAIVLWWHPLFWLARARLRLWAELACDAWAIASVPDATLDYATVLVDAVARPDPAVPAPAVLAARPAARAAFERRLTMILNENVPCRASRAWWLPFASLTLGLFTVPVAAQREQEPARVDLRVNGKAVDELSGAERTALLEQLLRAERREQRDDRDALPRPRGERAERAPREARAAEAREVGEVGEAWAPREGRTGGAKPRRAPAGLGLGEHVREALEAARVELEGDADLRELGIGDEVVRLLDDVVAGEDLGAGLHELIGAALHGVSKLVESELADDEDLRELGLAEPLQGLMRSLLDDDRTHEHLHDFVQRTVEEALRGMHGDAPAPGKRVRGRALDGERLRRGHGAEPGRDPHRGLRRESPAHTGEAEHAEAAEHAEHGEHTAPAPAKPRAGERRRR